MANKKSTPATTAAAIKIGKPQNIADLTYKTGEGRRGSEYDAIYAEMEKLKPGKVFTLECPADIDANVFGSRINAAIRRGPVKPPEGCVFRKRSTVDGALAIMCVKQDAKEAKAAPKPKAAKKAKAATEVVAE